MIRIWNYNKNRIHSYRGARYIEISLDGTPIFKGEVRRAPGAVLTPEECSECILYTMSDMILSLVEKYDPVAVPAGSSVCDDGFEGAHSGLVGAASDIPSFLQSREDMATTHQRSGKDGPGYGALTGGGGTVSGDWKDPPRGRASQRYGRRPPSLSPTRNAPSNIDTTHSLTSVGVGMTAGVSSANERRRVAEEELMMSRQSRPPYAMGGVDRGDGALGAWDGNAMERPPTGKQKTTMSNDISTFQQSRRIGGDPFAASSGAGAGGDRDESRTSGVGGFTKRNKHLDLGDSNDDESSDPLSRSYNFIPDVLLRGGQGQST